MRTVMAIDVGTTHIKSMLFCADGTVLAEEKTPTPLDETKEGSVYRPRVIWDIARRQLLSLADKAQGSCAGISITGMAEAGLVVNRDSGVEESDIIPWFDRRTTSLAGQAGADEEERIFARPGCGTVSSMVSTNFFGCSIITRWTENMQCGSLCVTISCTS